MTQKGKSNLHSVKFLKQDGDFKDRVIKDRHLGVKGFIGASGVFGSGILYNAFVTNMKTGANQVAAGAIACELWANSSTNVVYLGV